MAAEYDFNDDEEDEGFGSTRLDTVKNANGKRVSSGKNKESVFAPRTPDLGAAIDTAVASGKVQRYGKDAGMNGPMAESIPRLRPKNKLPNPEDAFDWARPDDVKRRKKGKNPNMLGLNNKQAKSFVQVPGMAGLFDFLNVYRKAKGGWR